MGAPRSRTPGRALPTFVLAAALVVWSHARHAVTHLDATELESFASSDDAADFFIQAFSPPAAHGLTQPGQAVEKNSSAGTGMIADGTHANTTSLADDHSLRFVTYAVHPLDAPARASLERARRRLVYEIDGATWDPASENGEFSTLYAEENKAEFEPIQPNMNLTNPRSGWNSSGRIP